MDVMCASFQQGRKAPCKTLEKSWYEIVLPLTSFRRVRIDSFGLSQTRAVVA
jgi:hypothetical protein